MRVLHVLHHSAPQLSGYSVRSGYILKHLGLHGLQVSVVTSAQQAGQSHARETLGGVEYRRTMTQPPATPILREATLMRALERNVDQATRAFSPDVIHAHSPVLVGLPALAVARRHRLPLVYEVRDLWENTSTDLGKFKDGSVRYRLARSLEGVVFERAASVVTICRQLAREIRPRLGSATTLDVVVNGVETETFQPQEPSASLLDRFGLRNKSIVGYVGSFLPYEGIDVLLHAMKALLQRHASAHLLMAGSGGAEVALKDLVRQLGIDHAVTFAGRIPHSEVKEFYATAHVMVYPRTLSKTTALTTPLKPLEAMAMGRPVVASDVPAMCELVEEGKTGLLFRAGDAHHLAARCLEVFDTPELAEQLGRHGRRWVEQERQWPGIIARYPSIYEAAVRKS